MDLEALLPLLQSLQDANGGPHGDFDIGDRVKIELGPDVLEILQQDHGGWNPGMKEVIQVPGTVEFHMRDNDYFILFDNGLRFLINGIALVRLPQQTERKRATLNVGDIVKIDGDVDKIRRMQEHCGGFNERMASVASRFGYVVSKTLVQVGVQTGPHKWGWNPTLLTRATPEDLEKLSNERKRITQEAGQKPRVIGPFDIVQVTNDLQSLKQMQNGHGNWVEPMQYIVGKYALVKRVFPSGDLRVRVAGRKWTLNPNACRLVVTSEECGIEVVAKKEKVAPEDPLQLMEILLHSLAASDPNNLFQAVAFGNVERVKELQKQGADMTQRLNDDWSVMHVAVGQQTNVAMIHHLATTFPTLLTQVDREGNTPLHMAAACGQVKNAEALLELGANVSAKNHNGQGALHKAVWKKSGECVRLLLNHRAPINMRDNDFGDTALHDAVTFSSLEAARILIDSNANLTAKNNRGFNVLFWAALKGNVDIFRMLIKLERVTLERIEANRTEDGFSILHVMAVNNHADCLETLLARFDQMNLNVHATVAQVSPLHLAAKQLWKEMVQLLLVHGANPNIMDCDGDTPLHLVTNMAHPRRGGNSEAEELNPLERLLQVLKGGEKPERIRDIAVSLVAAGANPYLRNFHDKTALDLCKDPDLQATIVQECSKEGRPEFPELLPTFEFTGTPRQQPSASMPSTSSSAATAEQPAMPVSVSSTSGGPSPSSHAHTAPDVTPMHSLIVGKREDDSLASKSDGRRNRADPSQENVRGVLISNIGHTKSPTMPDDQNTDSVVVGQPEETNTHEQDECAICRDRVAHTFLPCGHLMCRQCAQNLFNCPFCRSPYDEDELKELQNAY